ncbi:MAG TPA: hypothetical protein DCE23_04310 [Firmicutes bacterium]|nr:hypothetical protein [Bacillota bacterium]
MSNINSDKALNILYKDDLELYQTILDNYESLTSEDIDTAYTLAKIAILQADRWNEISFELTKKYREIGYTKSDLQNWAYHRYRVLMTIHDFCRVVYRQCSEDLRNRGADYYE